MMTDNDHYISEKDKQMVLESQEYAFEDTTSIDDVFLGHYRPFSRAILDNLKENNVSDHDQEDKFMVSFDGTLPRIDLNEQPKCFSCSSANGCLSNNTNTSRKTGTCAQDTSPVGLIFLEQLCQPLVFTFLVDNNSYQDYINNNGGYLSSQDNVESESDGMICDTCSISTCDTTCDTLSTCDTSSNISPHTGTHDSSIDPVDDESFIENINMSSPPPPPPPLSLPPPSPPPHVTITPCDNQTTDLYFISEDTMDTNHNKLKPTISITPAFRDNTIFDSDDYLGPAPFQAHRLTPVRESVSEDLVDLGDSHDHHKNRQNKETDDPFVWTYEHRDSSNHKYDIALSSLNSDTVISQQASPSISTPNSSTSSRLGSISDDMSPATRSPAPRRRQRRTGTSLDIEEVKELTSRLNLVTRRPSVYAWQQMHFDGDQPNLRASMNYDEPPEVTKNEIGPAWSCDFRDKINTSIDWLRSELISMREQDAILARQLLNIRKDMYKLKLQRSTQRHQMVLEEAMENEEERDELQQINHLDVPPDLFSPTLKQYGVTRMNIHSRRFSVF